jgi:hypothetical protein
VLLVRKVDDQESPGMFSFVTIEHVAKEFFYYRFVAVKNFDCAVINVCYRVFTNVDSLQSRIMSQRSLQS